MSDPFPLDDDAPPIIREFRRIFGVELDSDVDRPFLLLPLIGDDDALAFFQSVPAGTRWEDLVQLATEYRAAHPIQALPDS